MVTDKKDLNFNSLVSAIRQVHEHLTAQAIRAVNISLTLRNWLIGFYIEEYERIGIDRARYGDHLMNDLSGALQKQGIARCDRRELYRYRRFYLTYPQIVEAVTSQLLPTSQLIEDIDARKVEPVTPQLNISGKMLIEKLSFTHLAELIKIDDSLKRAFYEIECMRGNWCVRELKRQIGSLSYERSGLSENKKKLAEPVHSGTGQTEPKLAIRDPYIFEFLGIKSQEVMSESVLEDALLDKLQDFLLEMGHGFCFEARQKRILIGDTHSFVDLVFYHRILKCHILVELKLDEFRHEHIGQLNTYVNWYRKNILADGDNPPIGILLCTQKDHTLVEYALAGMDNNLFVSKYKLELPSKEDIRCFLEEKMKELGKG